MEILFTIAYLFLIRLVFFDYKWLKFNIYWGVALTGFYGLLALMEIVILGQVAPLSKESAVEGYVLHIQPQWPGYVQEVYVEPNKPVSKGDPLFKMDDEQWVCRVNDKKAELIQAERLLQDAQKLVPHGAMAKEQLLLKTEKVNQLKAQVEKAQFNVSHALTKAPTDGYIPILPIKPGIYLGLANKRVCSFISTDELWITAKVTQQAVRNIKPGDEVEVALRMYPGSILRGEVDSVIWGVGNTQVSPSGRMPVDYAMEPAHDFFVKIKMHPDKEHPLRYGASAASVIYTNESSFVFKLIRRIEIRSESFLNYLYNPF